MNTIVAVLGAIVLILLAVVKRQVTAVKKEKQKAQELGFRLERIEAINEIKRLEKAARESSNLADHLWDKYEHNREGGIWRPGDGDED